MLDNSFFSLDKNYLGFDLGEILKNGDRASFEIFWRVFQAANYIVPPGGQANIDKLIQRNKIRRPGQKSNLRNLIYGAEGQFSLFEEIGLTWLKANGRRSDAASLALIFEASLKFLFRLMFIAYFETRHQAELNYHPTYNNLSLKSIISALNPSAHQSHGWNSLIRLFQLFAPSERNLGLEFLGAGFFAPEQNPLLTPDLVIQDDQLSLIFDNLFKYNDDGQPLDRDFIEDFSPHNLVTIYEALLNFEFRVAEVDLYYVVSQRHQKDKFEGFIDKQGLDFLNHPLSIKRELPKDSLYLVNSSNNRKISGGYYTPDSLAWPLVTGGVKRQLEGLGSAGSILDLRVLDCACGGGRLLTVALSVLADQAMARLSADQDKKLNRLLSREMAYINDRRVKLGLEPLDKPQDKRAALKRLLLKHTIYGVDRSNLAVEIAKLSLLAETFIYGVPAPIIDRHIKYGDSLMGSDISSLSSMGMNDLFENHLINHLTKLNNNIMSFNYDDDLTTNQPSSSNHLSTDDLAYNNLISNINDINNINYHLNFINYLDILRIKKISPLPPIFSLLNARHLGQKESAQDRAQLAAWESEMKKTRDVFGFFNWKMEFPEVFSHSNLAGPGFHLITDFHGKNRLKLTDLKY
ncbi:MAG: hypothetical protein LBT86_03790 [Deltaproteobacteria bacterium]|nr:hypothetical protein [Deltaproteobacteria bacterium]